MHKARETSINLNESKNVLKNNNKNCVTGSFTNLVNMLNKNFNSVFKYFQKTEKYLTHL